MYIRLLLTIIVVCLVACVSAQTSSPKVYFLKHQQKNKIDSLEEVMEMKSQFRVQASYANKLIYAGRNFGVDQSGALFGTSYHHRSGFSIEYEGNYWSGMQNKYALTELGVYYEKSFLENLYFTGGYWRLFYHNGDNEERKMFTNFFLLDESWYTPIGQLNASYYFIKGNQTAHRLDINLSKALDFYNFLGADKFTIEPTLTFTFATIDYISFLSSYAEETNEEASGFTIGNYEFTLPVTYKRLGKYELNASWHQAWPVAIPGEEKPNPVSYFTFEIIRSLLSKK